MTKSYQFLSGGGEMGTLMRAYDWESSIIGGVDKWPQSLLTTLAILLNSKFPMFLFWGPKHICFYNDTYRPSLGNEGKHPSILGMKGEEAWPEIWLFIKPMIDKVLADGEASWYEDQLLPIFRNGKLEDVYWTFSYSPVKDESGLPVGVFVTCAETTDKVNNLKKLAESNNQLNFAIEATQLGTWDYNPLTNTFVGNHRFKEWFGLTNGEEFNISQAINVMVETDRSRVSQAIQKVLEYESGGFYDVEYGIINPITKQERIVQAKGKAWFGDDKKAYRFNGTLQDITQEATARRIIDESAKEQKKLASHLKLATDSAKVGIWSLDIVSSKLEWSKMHKIMWGYDEYFEDLTYEDWHKIILPEYKKMVFQKIEESKANHIIYEVDYQIKRVNDNSIVWIKSTGQYHYDELGTAQTLTGISIDISEQKIFAEELERKVNERTEELAIKTRQLEEMNQSLELKNIELENANDGLKSFTYIASHDLQEPLRKIQIFSKLIKEAEKFSDKTQNYFNRITAAIDHMQNLIVSLLDFSSTDTTKLIIVPCDLNATVEESKNELNIFILEKQAIIEYKDLPTINGSHIQLCQLFTNLISNAIKYSRPGIVPHIKITAERIYGKKIVHQSANSKKEYHVIKISDNGIGFENEYATKIFEVFQRLHAKNDYPGTGIGLAIVKKIATNHHGFILAEGKPGLGSTFSLFVDVMLGNTEVYVKESGGSASRSHTPIGQDL